VMNSLKRETTTAKHRSSALSPPASVLRRSFSSIVFSVSLRLCGEMVFVLNVGQLNLPRDDNDKWETRETPR